MVPQARPKVLSLRHPRFAGEEYLQECSKWVELDVGVPYTTNTTPELTLSQVLEASTREQAIEGIKHKVQTCGPYVGFMMLCKDWVS